eukprot:scaffold141984_cov62-Attheya_sp.AAC.2
MMCAYIMVQAHWIESSSWTDGRWRRGRALKHGNPTKGRRILYPAIRTFFALCKRNRWNTVHFAFDSRKNNSHSPSP